ncbi:hypothetical protein BGZ61DRAFT_584023 [Ilyonectria robusta]|uniref:uncharacterized protein n=1 Tax=Ilyonectria robusta TaxID=1079257 RepID=UPI001E8DC628|nr:uncharacterized protein BGZ61DRAFT_584023 [Ilyonectria robusta]KAH8736249.1 hypothetical protein BGZ61DRAFT_584023 [Ilyonectria robusta]
MKRYVDLALTSLKEIEDADTRLPLDAIDRLRYLQLGDVAKLPQIIVVGDRSSGKSSILHAISGIEFPIDNDLGTRFTTELIFRRAKSHYTLVQFVKSSISEIIGEAIQRMGLPKSKLSQDILRIEVYSPKLTPLTLIDLPGFVQPSSGLQEERILVDKITKRYIKQPNSIILVASAANCAINRGALQTARRYDRTGERTFGIITKPDLLNEESKTELHLQFSRYVAKLPNLPRGWHVLRNRSQTERYAQANERDQIETRFIQTGVLSSLPLERLGIHSLRKTLNDVLVGHTENKLQQLIETIQSNTVALEAQQAKLTNLRMNSELRTYLTSLADGFHRLALDAIHGKYAATFSSSLHNSEMKPRKQIQNLNRAFCVTMSTKGASRVIQQDGERNWNVKDGRDHSGKDEEVSVRETKQTRYPDPLQPFLDLYDFPDPEPISESTLKLQLERLAAVNQGTGFPGIPNREIAIGLFKTQSKPWKAIAERHIENVTSYAKTFVERLLKHVLGSDDRTEKALLEHVVTPFFRKRGEQMRVKLEEILQPYSDGCSMPDDAEFQDYLSKRSVQDLMDRVVDRFSEWNMSTSTYKNHMDSLELKAALRMLANVEMSRSCISAAEKALRMATAHYEISRRSFTQHIVNLVVESCLVRKIPGMFTAKSVAQMDELKLRELVPVAQILQDSETLQKKLHILNAALHRIQQYKVREKEGGNHSYYFHPREIVRPDDGHQTGRSVLTVNSLSSSTISSSPRSVSSSTSVQTPDTRYSKSPSPSDPTESHPSTDHVKTTTQIGQSTLCPGSGTSYAMHPRTPNPNPSTDQSNWNLNNTSWSQNTGSLVALTSRSLEEPPEQRNTETPQTHSTSSKSSEEMEVGKRYLRDTLHVFAYGTDDLSTMDTLPRKASVHTPGSMEEARKLSFSINLGYIPGPLWDKFQQDICTRNFKLE